MENTNNQLNEKITDFFRASFEYYGSEIYLQSNQHFGIDQIINEEKQQQGEYAYHIQYGFPSSGCVSMDCGYSQSNDTFSINKVTVYAPPADKEMIVATFAPQAQIDEVNVSANFGIDAGTEEHNTIDSIANNPNAIKMLEIAIGDLSEAEIIGECRVSVPMESKTIPCSNSTNRRKNK